MKLVIAILAAFLVLEASSQMSLFEHKSPKLPKNLENFNDQVNNQKNKENRLENISSFYQSQILPRSRRGVTTTSDGTCCKLEKMYFDSFLILFLISTQGVHRMDAVATLMVTRKIVDFINLCMS